MEIRVMIVDDEPLIIETMGEYLQQLLPNAQIRSFTNPMKALEALREQAADIAFLDIQMPGSTNGIQLALQMKCVVPELKVVFCTGYSEYALDAFKVRADGYLCKPIMRDTLQAELEHAFRRERELFQEKPFLRTFGSFDLFVKGEPILFKRLKSKEALAYITDRRGGWVSNNELICGIWENYDLDTTSTKYASLLIAELIGDLRQYGVEQILERKRGKARIRMEAVDCDYYALLAGSVEALNSFQGEYMAQYSWGERTLGDLIWRRNS